MNVHILISIDSRKKLKEDIFNKKETNDRVDFLDFKQKTNVLDEYIQNSSYSFILVVSTYFKPTKENYIQKTKNLIEKDHIVIYTNEFKKDKNGNKNLPSSDTIILFDKRNRDFDNDRTKNISVHIRKIISQFENIKRIKKETNIDNNQKVGGKLTSRSDKINPYKEAQKTNITTQSDKINPYKEAQKTNITTQSEKDKEASKKQSKKDKEGQSNLNDSSPPKIKNGIPKILFICDVKGWAWWLKSEYIKKYLSDEFDIDIITRVGEDKTAIDTNKYDLYFTFGYSFVRNLNKVPFNRRITGVTAHRPLETIKPKIKKTYAAHANSVLLLNELKQIHNNCYYTPNGVDTEMFYPQKESDIFERDYINIGHVGKLSPQKGQKKIIEPVIEKLKERGNKVNYIPHYNNYMNRIPHSEMPNLYQNMDCLIVASFEDGTPNNLIEGASCGVPTIGNKIGNLPEFITQGVNGYIVEEPTIDNYIKLIESLNKKHLVEMGKNARQTAVNEWDWKIQAENYRYMFRDILGLNNEKV